MSDKPLAGRCACGMILEWVARDPDEHLKCYGLRWCGVCGEAAIKTGPCPECNKRYRLKYRLAHKRPKNTPAQLAQSRRWKAHQRRLNSPQYQKEKAAKRLRYATDPAHAAAKREAVRVYDARQRATRKSIAA